MLCQNCKRNDAGVHLKRIVNGESAEIHLCAVCAASFGVSNMITGLSFSSDGIGSFSSQDLRRGANKTLCCETCGFSFEDIANTGRPGCADCYRVFSHRLRPTVIKLHGRATYKGKVPQGSKKAENVYSEIEMLRAQLAKAVEEENFELAAVLRDEIRALEQREAL